MNQNKNFVEKSAEKNCLPNRAILFLTRLLNPHFFNAGEECRGFDAEEFG